MSEQRKPSGQWTGRRLTVARVVVVTWVALMTVAVVAVAAAVLL